jgi:autotransporter-associated beta strand protein
VSNGYLSVGADTLDDKSIEVGDGGTNTAQLNVSGAGVVTMGQGDFNVGNLSPGAINQSGGDVEISPGAAWLYVGRNDNGSYSLSGGTLTVPNHLVLGNAAGTTGTFNLNGGTATIGQIQGGSGTGIFNFNGGTLQAAASNTAFMQGLTTANVQSGGAIIDTHGFSVTIAQPLLAAGGGLTKTGNGTLTLSGNNTFSGGLTVELGLLQIATINNAATNGPLGNNTSVTLGTTKPLSGTVGTLEFTGGSAASNMPFVLAGLAGGVFRVDNASTNLTLSGTISGGELYKYGSGTLTLSGNNSFSGDVLPVEGTLVMGSPGALNSAGVNSLAMEGGTVSLAGNNLTVANLAGNSGIVQDGTSSTPTLTVNNAISNTYGGIIQDGPGGGALSLVKNSPGTLTLNGNNLFTGGVTINGGELQLGNPGALNSSAPNAVTFGAGGTGILSLNGNSVTVSGLTTGTPTGTPVVQNGNSIPATLTVSNATDNTYSGTLQNGSSGALSLAKAGFGTLTLTGNNSFTGGVTLQQGTLLIGNDAALGTGTLTMSDGARIEADGGARTVNNSITLNAGSQGRVFVDGSNDLTLNGVIRGTGMFVKNGNGTLTLANDNEYVGPTRVNAGTLSVNDLLRSDDVEVSTGGTLSGVGFVGYLGGSVTVTSGGFISPGNGMGPGPLSVSSLILNSGATMNIELGGTTRGSQYSELDAANNAMLDGTLNVLLVNGFKPAAGNSFVILAGGSLSGTFASVQLPDLGGRIVWDQSQLYTTGTLAVTSTFYAGDVNRDSRVDVADVSAMMTALSDLSTYQATHGPGGGALTNQQLLDIADLDNSGAVTNADLQGLINLLANGGGSGSVTAVPEPASLSLLATGALVLLLNCRRRKWSAKP